MFFAELKNSHCSLQNALSKIQIPILMHGMAFIYAQFSQNNLKNHFQTFNLSRSGGGGVENMCFHEFYEIYFLVSNKIYFLVFNKIYFLAKCVL